MLESGKFPTKLKNKPLSRLTDGKLTEQEAVKKWFATHVEKVAKKDKIPAGERWGNAFGAAAIIVGIWFFVIHQTRPTGFFTEDFGVVESALFYIALLFGVATSMSRMVIGRKNAVRPLEALSSAFTLVALVRLLVVFPFDFSHLADPLPRFLEFLLQWISGYVAPVLMVLGIIGSAATAAYNAVMYAFVRRELAKPKPVSI